MMDINLFPVPQQFNRECTITVFVDTEKILDLFSAWRNLPTKARAHVEEFLMDPLEADLEDIKSELEDHVNDESGWLGGVQINICTCQYDWKCHAPDDWWFNTTGEELIEYREKLADEIMRKERWTDYSNVADALTEAINDLGFEAILAEAEATKPSRYYGSGSFNHYTMQGEIPMQEVHRDVFRVLSFTDGPYLSVSAFQPERMGRAHTLRVDNLHEGIIAFGKAMYHGTEQILYTWLI